MRATCERDTCERGVHVRDVCKRGAYTRGACTRAVSELDVDYSGAEAGVCTGPGHDTKECPARCVCNKGEDGHDGTRA